MKKVFLLVAGSWLLVTDPEAQTISQRLQKAYTTFQSDNQLKHAVSSLYVIDAATGDVVFDKNSGIGLAGASTQKIITAATAFELLGKDYTYPWGVWYKGVVRKDTLFGDIIIDVQGDPTFGSSRFRTNKDFVLSFIKFSINLLNVKVITGNLVINDSGFDDISIPDGWIWQDIGNYYGAASRGLNWGENQFDMYLSSGKEVGEYVKMVRTDPDSLFDNILNELVSGKAGSGDNAYIYYLPQHKSIMLKGTIPVNEINFKISGSLFLPTIVFSKDVTEYLQVNGIKVLGSYIDSKFCKENNMKMPVPDDDLGKASSVGLDSIVYWFLKKSINLYGEALIKTFAFEKKGYGSTDSGVAVVRKFWKERGLDEEELNIRDGSGLSPLNRITTHAEVEVLKYAKTRTWFPFFLDALPEYNGMKMKSGTISDVKGFCGYHKSKEGRDYIFSFLVNNYSGKTSGVVNKMYQVLDVLK